MQRAIIFNSIFAMLCMINLAGAAMAADDYSGRYVSETDKNASVNISYLEDNDKAMGLIGYTDKKAKKTCKFEFQATVKEGHVYSRSETAVGCTLNVDFTEGGLTLRLDDKCMASFCKEPVTIPGGAYKKVSKTPVMR